MLLFDYIKESVFALSIISILFILGRSWNMIEFFLLKKFRYRIGSHDKFTLVLDYIEDENLKLYYKERLESEAFEHATGFRLKSEARRLFLNLSVELREEFDTKAILKVYPYFRVDKAGKKLYIPSMIKLRIENGIYITFVTLYCLMFTLALALVKFGSETNNEFVEGFWWIPLLALTMFIIYRVKLLKLVKKFSVFFENYYSG